MDPKVELIEMPSTDEVYAQLNGEGYKMTSENASFKRLNFWLNLIMKTLALILIATLIVVLLALSWSLFLNPFHAVKTNDEPKIEVANCGTDWIEYKDEKCFQILSDTFQTFEEAVESCGKLEDSNVATLPVIHSKEEQDFLADYLFRVFQRDENFWIGARVAPNNTFRWIDASELTFTNWVTKGPKAKVNYCVQMLAEEDSLGKWIDESCQEKNFVVCQKMQSWSVDRLQKIVISVRKNHGDLLEEAKREINENKQSLIPIGFIYAQLPNETSPEEIWPQLNWTDVSDSYAGVFFRVNGSDAAAFGEVQQENAPKLEEVYVGDIHRSKTGTQVASNSEAGITIPKSGWSDGINTGTNGGNKVVNIYTQFKHSTGEVRPRNMAIRIWKRTG